MNGPLRFAVVGDPIAHSKSPLMHAAAYRALGMPHTYERIHTKVEELSAVVARLRTGALAGLNVTVPHKVRVLDLVDELAPSAFATGAANTLVRAADGRVTAHNTDAPALRAEIATLAARDLRGERALVLGAGGAGRASVAALAGLGLGVVVCRGRRFADSAAAAEARDVLQRVVDRAGGSCRVEIEPLAAREDDGRFGVLVQATSAGMSGAEGGEAIVRGLELSAIAAPTIAIDLVYAPPRTPFLEAAASRGLPHANGLGMLVRQGALAFELWLGVAPSLDAMRAAIG